MKHTKLNLIGIDVSSKELVVKIEKQGKTITGVSVFNNNKQGHKKLAKYITKNGYKAKVCMEATGIYHFDLAIYLSNSKNVQVMVVNPKAIKHFGIAMMSRSKTDPIDANLILNYLKRMDFREWQAPCDAYIQLQALSRRISQLKNEILREDSRLHANDFTDALSDIISNDIEVNKRHLSRRIAILEEKALSVINEHIELKKKYELLISVKGIAKASALQILAEIICLPDDMSVKQWVAFAGLDPIAKESGTSVNKPRRISKTGNKYLRTALYMPAWVAVRTNSEVKEFYTKLVTAGKKPMQAIVAVMRKLLHAIWGMLNSNSEWDSSRFYTAK